MELAWLAIVVVSATAGFLCRGRLRATAVRAVLAAGFLVLIAGLSLVGLAAIGRGPLSTWTTGLVSAGLLGLAGILLPFALAARPGGR